MMKAIKFSREQEQALILVQLWRAEWAATHERQIFRLFGYAGTGKTTLIQYIAEMWGGNVLFATFTGKVASVMRSKGCTGACTIYSLIMNYAGSGITRGRDLAGAD